MTLKFTDLQSRLQEAKDDTVVFAFGRFNPMTVGHAKLMKAVETQGKSASAHFVYASHSVDNKKNPLEPKFKKKILAKAFPRNKIEVSSKSMPTAMHIASHLFSKGYKNLVMVAGDDRVQEFQTLLDKYNGTKGRHGEYKFDTIKVVSAGARDADADDASGASGTKMREYAARNDYESFAKYSPQTLSDREVKSVFDAVRKKMPKLDNEQFEPIAVREEYLLGKLFEVGDTVYDLNEGAEYEIIECGPNFVYCRGEDGNVYTKWLSDVGELNEVRQDTDVKDKEGTQPAKYYAGLKTKSTKSARDAHFKKGAKKSDNDPSAYKPAPGDADAKTKPSTHTKKFKQMFGEVQETEDEQNRDVDRLSGVDEGLWDNIRKKKERIKQGSGEKMRSKGDKGAPTPDQISRASEEIDERDFKTDRKLKNLKTFIGKSSVGDTASRAKKRKAQRRGTNLAADLCNEQAEVAFEVEVEGIGTMLVAGANKQEVKQRLQKMFRDARKFSIGKRLMDPQIKMWYRAKAKDVSEEIEYDIDEFLEEDVNITEDEELAKELEDTIDDYDEIEDVEDIYPDLDDDGDHDDEDWDKLISSDGMERSVIDDNYKWVDEVLTPAQRFKRSQQMRRLKGKIARARAISLKRPSSPEKLQTRAQRHARNLIRKKFIKGKNYNDLSFAEKQAVEKKMQGKQGLIARIAMRVKPKLKKMEQERLRNMNKQESRLIESNIYRVGSELYYETFNDWKKSIDRDDLDSFDRELLESDIGSHAMYEGNHVPLDCPMMEEEQPELNKPKAGGTKKYYVYVKDPSSGNVKKVSWGDTSGLKIKLNDPEARKSFAARHQCSTKKDKTKPGYWACRMPYYAKQLGLSGGGNYFW